MAGFIDQPTMTSDGPTIRANAGLHRRAEITILFGIALVCLLVRLIAALRTPVIQKDSIAYIEIAQAIAGGNFFDPASQLRALHPAYPTAITWAYAIASDWEVAGHIVSILCSVLTCLPIHLISREILGVRGGLICCCLYALHPTLAEYQHDILSHSLFLLVFLSSIWLSWRSSSKRTLPYSLISGLFAAVALLTRPEGVLLWVGIPIFLLVPCVSAFRRRNQARWKVTSDHLVLIVFFLIGAGLASSPYLAWIHDVKGHLWFTPKSIIPGEALQNLEDPPFQYLSASVGPAGTVALRDRFAYEFTKKLLDSLYVPIIPFLVVGMIFMRRHRTWNIPATGIILIACLYMLAGAYVGWKGGSVSTRYFLSPTLLLLVFAAAGVEACLLSLAKNQRAQLQRISGAGLGLLLLLPTCAWRGTEKLGFKEAGKWILATYGPRQTIATHRAEAAWYAKGIPVPLEQPPDASKVRFLVFWSRHWPHLSQQEEFLNRWKSHAQITKLKTFEKGVEVWEVQSTRK